MRQALPALLAVAATFFPVLLAAEEGGVPLLTGHAASADWHADRPGVRRRIVPADMPPPYASRPVANTPDVVEPPADARPAVPQGFAVSRFATGLDGPRLLRVAPDGDVFVAESEAGRIELLRTIAAGRSAPPAEFAAGLDMPFGIAFYPPGPDPKWVYVAETNAVVRFPYSSGDVRVRAAPQTIVARLAGSRGGHVTRDIAFSADARTMYVSVGSGTNIGEDLARKSPADVQQWQSDHALGAAWGAETDRADVLAFDPDGGHRRVFATGLRNCVGLARRPMTDELWCSTNERDLLGDDLPPDYVTRVRDGAFYGWPWYFIGDHEDPRRHGERPDLAGKASVPDVLLQSHSAPLQMTFYEAAPGGSAVFPETYRGDAFVALHGSWNRAKRTGYKVIRVRLDRGVPTGEYDDFLTGFVLDDSRVWARPVGVAVAGDGALLVSDDGNGVVWRVAPAAVNTAK